MLRWCPSDDAQLLGCCSMDTRLCGCFQGYWGCSLEWLHQHCFARTTWHLALVALVSAHHWYGISKMGLGYDRLHASVCVTLVQHPNRIWPLVKETVTPLKLSTTHHTLTKLSYASPVCTWKLGRIKCIINPATRTKKQLYAVIQSRRGVFWQSKLFSRLLVCSHP